MAKGHIFWQKDWVKGCRRCVNAGACSQEIHDGKILHCHSCSLDSSLTDCMNLGTHVVTSSFKPASLNPKTASRTQFLFGRFSASQNITEISRNVFPVVHAISPYSLSFYYPRINRRGNRIGRVCRCVFLGLWNNLMLSVLLTY